MRKIPKLIPSKFPSFINKLSRLSISTNLQTPPPQPPPAEAATVATILNSLENPPNWATLTRKLKSTQLTNSVIEKVLIQLKDHPLDAKKALSFFHWSAQFNTTKHSHHIYSLTIHILVRAKLIKDARALLESVLTRAGSCNSLIYSFVDSLIGFYEITSSSPFVFDLLVQTCSKLRMIDEAIDLCYYLGERGFKLSVISCNTLIHVIQKSDRSFLVWKVYEYMIENRIYPNEATVRIMVSALCKEGKLKKFVDMISRIHGKRCLPGVIVNTCLVYGMIEEGRVEDGLVLLKRLLLKNMIFDTISCSLIVYGKVKLGDLESAWQVFEEMLKRGFNENSFMFTLFIGAYCEVGRIEEAVELFREMESGGLKAYDETLNHLVVGCSRVGRFDESLMFCKKIAEIGYVPSLCAFNEMIERLCENGSARQGDEMLTLVLDKGFVPDVSTYSHLIAGFAREGDVEGALKLYYEMEFKSLPPGELVLTSLITSLCQHRRLEEADKYLSVMKERSLSPSAHTYETLIACLSEKDEHTRAKQLQTQMVHKGLVMTPVADSVAPLRQ